MQKTASEIIEDLKKRIVYGNPLIDTTATGNVVVDLGVEAFANELAACYTEEDRVRMLYLFDTDSFTDEEADILAASFGVYRNDPVKSTGTVTFCASNLPSSETVYTIPAGLVVTTGESGQSQQAFITTTVGTITTDTPLNPITGYYEATVNVQASIAGASGNVSAGSINTITNPPSGIYTVYNSNAFVNGADQETTASLINRTKLRLQGAVYGTKAAYLEKTLSDPNIKDAMVVDPNSEFVVRGPGTVDIYILGSTYTSATQDVVIATSGQSVVLNRQPVLVGSFSVVLDGVTYTEGHGFYIKKDEESAYASSSKAQDTLVWDETTYNNVVKTSESTYYTISYSYNSLISMTQESFDDSDVRMITADVLIRDTYRVDVAMDFDIVSMAGYDKNTVIQACKDNIQTFINNFKLGAGLHQSDIINIVENTNGVDYIKLPMRQFNLVNVEGVTDVECAPLEYLRIDSGNILIS